MSQSRNQDESDDEQRFRDALAFIDCVATLNRTTRSALDWVPLSQRTKAFFAEYGVPPWLRAFLERHSYRGPLSIGQASFDSIDKLSHSDDGDFEVTCLRDGLLPVGCGPSGDLIVVDMRSGLAGFVAMAELAQATEAADAGELTEPARSVLALSPFRIGAFYLAAGQHAHDPYIYERFFPTRSRNIDEQPCWERFVAEPGAPLRATATRTTVPLLPATEAFFAARAVGPALRAFLAAHAYLDDLDFAGYRLYAVNELPARQARMSGPFLAVGAVCSPYFGTYEHTEIVVDARSGRAGLVEHSSPSGSALSPYDLPTFLHLAEKYSLLAQSLDTFPIDYYAACECDWTRFATPPQVPLTQLGAFPPA